MVLFNKAAVGARSAREPRRPLRAVRRRFGPLAPMLEMLSPCFSDALPVSNWFYWVLLGFTGFYWVLLLFSDLNGVFKCPFYCISMV